MHKLALALGFFKLLNSSKWILLINMSDIEIHRTKTNIMSIIVKSLCYANFNLLHLQTSRNDNKIPVNTNQNFSA